ncbi:hypothetical protein DVDV_1983 [Desulfovibrio sp. DV]|nr:hypothetical protein DVDV_1983 [Desulfovibrio sp. DV]
MYAPRRGGNHHPNEAYTPYPVKRQMASPGRNIFRTKSLTNSPLLRRPRLRRA